MTVFTSSDYHIVEGGGGDGDKGMGLFTSRPYASGESIYPFDYWSLELTPMHATNHSCDPNASFDADGMLVALRDIAVDEEITYDYLLHPVPASPWSFRCQCGAAGCIGWLQAA